jgi:hypothetical protein
MEGIIDDKEDILLTTKLNLFTIGIITLPELKNYVLQFLMQKSKYKTLHSTSTYLKERFWFILVLHVSKFKSWRLCNGSYMRITKYECSIWGLLKIFKQLS